MKRSVPIWASLWFLILGTVPSMSAQDSQNYYRVDGQNILDRSGNPVVMRGVGLGGWLMPEGYMIHIPAPDGGSPRTIRSQIQRLIGPAATEQFFEIYRANYVEEKDVAAIAEWGFDHIRLPFHYDVFFDPATATFKEDGFALLDEFLRWCRTHNIHVILDMHAAPGAQNSLNISDSDGTARLWTEIARRYAEEPLIIGYDLINEPVLPEGVTSVDLRALNVRLTQAIRAVDTNHILFIEGNWFATDFTGLTPPFDDNMVYAFHKYWNATDQGTIQYLLNIRRQYNVPLWLGESGENSNTWFYEVTRMLERNDVGWNWWTHKKIETTTSPLSAPFAPGYEDVLNFWRGSGPRPSEDDARNALFAMAEGLDLDSCEVRPGVLASLFDPDYSSRRKPFRENVIPGFVNAADYDIGNQGVTYFDTDYMATSGAPGGGNTGGTYRNDGVDIAVSTDARGDRHYVGWTEANEWMSYTFDAVIPGTYDIEVRVASPNGRGVFRLLIDGSQVGGDLSAVNTGGDQNWASVKVEGVPLSVGSHSLTLSILEGGFNVNRMYFSLAGDPDAFSDMQLYGHFPNPTRNVLNVQFRTVRAARAEVVLFDSLGRKVSATGDRAFEAGTHTFPVEIDLAPGIYFYRLTLEDTERRQTFENSAIVAD
jgi:hypothetical protein